ncbi:MAG: alkaline phosphatase [Proteobacteria bacterium]|nr:alkaline phosphatase [Pseudomonadota bacterium]
MLLLLLSCTRAPETTPKDSTSDSTPTAETGHTGETAHTGESTHSDPPDSGDDSDPPDTGLDGPPRIVLFIGDGMGFEHVAGGGLLDNGAKGTLSFESMPHQGNLQTASVTGTTDSAASGTAMATGTKTVNGFLGVDQAHQDLESLSELARARGMSVGIVTTDKITGATPSAFTAHRDSRGDIDGIIEDIFATPPEILLGGGQSQLADALVDNEDFQVLSTADDLASLVPDGRPVLGLFAGGELEYKLFKPDDSTEPTLAEMTTAALDLLEDDTDGYFLMVEGARIDHASHGQMPDAVHFETSEFAKAVQVAMDRADEDTVIVVTADHECGGMYLDGNTTEEGYPGTLFHWGLHTNDDVGVWAQGPRTQWFHEERRQNVWVHTVLASVIEDEVVDEPYVPPLIDGATDDVGSVITTQSWTTSHSDNQLDALRVGSDGAGMRIGLDGVYGPGMTPLLLIDVDLGEGTGLASDNTLADPTGELDLALSALTLDVQVEGLGFDLAVGALNASPVDFVTMDESAGLRGVGDPWVNPNDLYWLFTTTAFDYGNIGRHGNSPTDAGSAGTTENGWEILIPWHSIYPDGMPATGLEVGLFAVVVDNSGTDVSNQTLPAATSATAPGVGAVVVEQVVHLTVDSTGVMTSTPAVYP